MLVTSAPAMMAGGTGNLLVTASQAMLAEHRTVDNPPNGLGDLCAAVFLARLLAGQPMAKAHYGVKVGDVLTFPLGPHIRVIKVVAPGTRRGPATEARTLYEDLEPPVTATRPENVAPESGQPPQRDPGSGGEYQRLPQAERAPPPQRQQRQHQHNQGFG